MGKDATASISYGFIIPQPKGPGAPKPEATKHAQDLKVETFG